MKIHLHTCFPYSAERPNAALGYLKSYLSCEGHHVTNVYWNVLPEEIFSNVSSILTKLQGKKFDKFDSLTTLTACFARFLYRHKERETSAIEPLINVYTYTEEVEDAARAFKDYVDWVLENGNMADTDVAGFSTNFSQWLIGSYIWSHLKKANPNITLVAGGFFTQDEAKSFMKTFGEVDYSIWGEGEIPLRELVSCDHSSLEDIPRLVYRKKGETICTRDPDSQDRPFPFGDHKDYFDQLKKCGLSLSPRIPIQGSRFCRWKQCKFCHMTRSGTYMERPVADIVEEIEYQSRTHNINEFIFVDTDVGRKSDDGFKALLTALLESVDTRKMPYDIQAEISPVRITRACAEMMSAIKMDVQVGFEAVSDSLLRKMRKMHGVCENIQALKVGKECGLNLFGLNILRNLPGEREEDVIESIKNLKFVRFFLRHYQLKPIELTLYKGTPYYDDIPAEERESRWVANFLYREIQSLDLLCENLRWDFFGFRACDLMHHKLWDEFTQALETICTSRIYYSWLEFSDGSSLIEEYNEISGYKGYLLTGIETAVLKLSDSIEPLHKVESQLCGVPKEEIENAVTQLRKEGLLYVDEQRKLLISLVSVGDIKSIQKMK